MRWTFANEPAWKVLSSGTIEYPDGAIVAKIGAVTHEDSQFPSSAVPNGARRFQFIVRDAKKFSETGGWGYSLFDVEGKIFADPVKETTMACYACHQIVENRGQVFSQPFSFMNGANPKIVLTFLSKQKGFRTIEFAWAETSALSEALRGQIPKTFKRIRVVRDAVLQKNLFQGTEASRLADLTHLSRCPNSTSSSALLLKHGFAGGHQPPCYGCALELIGIWHRGLRREQTLARLGARELRAQSGENENETGQSEKPRFRPISKLTRKSPQNHGPVTTPAVEAFYTRQTVFGFRI